MLSEMKKPSRLDIYAPRMKGDFSTLLSNVEKVLSHSRANAVRRGFQPGIACVFSENAIYRPYSAGLSEAKRFADRLQKRLPKDPFFAIGFCVALRDGLDGRNEGFLVTSDGWQHSSKIQFTNFDCETIVRLFGKCDFDGMYEKFNSIPFPNDPIGLPFCRANAQAGVCMIHKACDCHPIEANWHARSQEYSELGKPFISANGKNGIKIEYYVCGDAQLAPYVDLPDTVSLVSAYGLNYSVWQGLGQKRMLVAVNDSRYGRGLLVAPVPRLAEQANFNENGWHCDTASVS